MAQRELPPDYSPEFIADLKRRAASPGPWYSGEDIQAMFRLLEDMEAEEGTIDDKRLKELLDNFEARHGRFIELIERSRKRVRDEGGISSEEMRRRFTENR